MIVGGSKDFSASADPVLVAVGARPETRLARTAGIKDAIKVNRRMQTSRPDIYAAGDCVETWDHKVYYPGAQKMRIRLTGDRNTRRILGAQIVGHVSSGGFKTD